MKKTVIIIISLLFIVFPSYVFAGVADNLKGMILLQVEENGEAWYVNPNNSQRYYLGRPDDAFGIMRELGLGISEKDFKSFNGTAPSRLSGRILLRVEEKGEAYYIYPKDLKIYYLGRPIDAFNLMRRFGLGITNANLNLIPSFRPISNNSIIDTGNSLEAKEVEQSVFQIINNHRESIGAESLIWSDVIAGEARKHSANMASGSVAPGHEGFYDRMDAIRSQIAEYNGGAENLAWNYGYADPADTAYKWWLTSPSHKASLEEPIYDYTGVGTGQSPSGEWFITQIFINVN